MPDTSAVTTEVIAVLHRAIHAASQDYFTWTRGHILWDAGVERMMQVYAAARLFEGNRSHPLPLIRSVAAGLAFV